MRIVIFQLFCVVSAWAQDSRGGVAEFRRQVDILNERYEDFFAREQELRRYHQALRDAIPALKSERRVAERAYAEALRQHLMDRRAKPDTSQLEREFEEEKRREAAAFDRIRAEYSRQQKELKRISESARQIPPNRDAGLE